MYLAFQLAQFVVKGVQVAAVDSLLHICESIVDSVAPFLASGLCCQCHFFARRIVVQLVLGISDCVRLTLLFRFPSLQRDHLVGLGARRVALQIFLTFKPLLILCGFLRHHGVVTRLALGGSSALSTFGVIVFGRTLLAGLDIQLLLADIYQIAQALVDACERVRLCFGVHHLLGFFLCVFRAGCLQRVVGRFVQLAGRCQQSVRRDFAFLEVLRDLGEFPRGVLHGRLFRVFPAAERIFIRRVLNGVVFRHKDAGHKLAVRVGVICFVVERRHLLGCHALVEHFQMVAQHADGLQVLQHTVNCFLRQTFYSFTSRVDTGCPSEQRPVSFCQLVDVEVLLPGIPPHGRFKLTRTDLAALLAAQDGLCSNAELVVHVAHFRAALVAHPVGVAGHAVPNHGLHGAVTGKLFGCCLQIVVCSADRGVDRIVIEIGSAAALLLRQIRQPLSRFGIFLLGIRDVLTQAVQLFSVLLLHQLVEDVLIEEQATVGVLDSSLIRAVVQRHHLLVVVHGHRAAETARRPQLFSGILRSEYTSHRSLAITVGVHRSSRRVAPAGRLSGFVAGRVPHVGCLRQVDPEQRQCRGYPLAGVLYVVDFQPFDAVSCQLPLGRQFIQRHQSFCQRCPSQQRTYGVQLLPGLHGFTQAEVTAEEVAHGSALYVAHLLLGPEVVSEPALRIGLHLIQCVGQLCIGGRALLIELAEGRVLVFAKLGSRSLSLGDGVHQAVVFLRRKLVGFTERFRAQLVRVVNKVEQFRQRFASGLQVGIVSLQPVSALINLGLIPASKIRRSLCAVPLQQRLPLRGASVACRIHIGRTFAPLRQLVDILCDSHGLLTALFERAKEFFCVVHGGDKRISCVRPAFGVVQRRADACLLRPIPLITLCFLGNSSDGLRFCLCFSDRLPVLCDTQLTAQTDQLGFLCRGQTAAGLPLFLYALDLILNALPLFFSCLCSLSCLLGFRVRRCCVARQRLATMQHILIKSLPQLIRNNSRHFHCTERSKTDGCVLRKAGNLTAEALCNLRRVDQTAGIAVQAHCITVQLLVILRDGLVKRRLLVTGLSESLVVRIDKPKVATRQLAAIEHIPVIPGHISEPGSDAATARPERIGNAKYACAEADRAGCADHSIQQTKRRRARLVQPLQSVGGHHRHRQRFLCRFKLRLTRFDRIHPGPVHLVHRALGVLRSLQRSLCLIKVGKQSCHLVRPDLTGQQFEQGALVNVAHPRPYISDVRHDVVGAAEGFLVGQNVDAARSVDVGQRLDLSTKFGRALGHPFGRFSRVSYDLLLPLQEGDRSFLPASAPSFCYTCSPDYIFISVRWTAYATQLPVPL